MSKNIIQFVAFCLISVMGYSAFAYSQEAYVSFTNYAPTDPTPSTENLNSYASYLIKSETIQSASAFETWLKNNGGFTRENLSSKTENTETGLYNILEGSPSWNSESKQYQLAYANCTGNYDKYNYLVTLASDKTTDVAYEIMLGTAERVDREGGNWTYKYIFSDADAGSVTWKTIPEPTSGLLLLLGVAGLALKRKHL